MTFKTNCVYRMTTASICEKLSVVCVLAGHCLSGEIWESKVMAKIKHYFLMKSHLQGTQLDKWVYNDCFNRTGLCMLSLERCKLVNFYYFFTRKRNVWANLFQYQFKYQSACKTFIITTIKLIKNWDVSTQTNIRRLLFA